MIPCAKQIGLILTYAAVCCSTHWFNAPVGATLQLTTHSINDLVWTTWETKWTGKVDFEHLYLIFWPWPHNPRNQNFVKCVQRASVHLNSQSLSNFKGTWIIPQPSICLLSVSLLRTHTFQKAGISCIWPGDPQANKQSQHSFTHTCNQIINIT